MEGVPKGKAQHSVGLCCREGTGTAQGRTMLLVKGAAPCRHSWNSIGL